MKNLDFATEELICSRIKEIQPELEELVLRTLNSCGNRYVDDVIQDTYIKALKLFLNANLILSEFRNQVIALCQEICFEYFYAEKQNYAKPRKYIASNKEDIEDLDQWLWEKVKDTEGNMDRRMIAKEEIEAIKQVKGKYLTFYNAREFVATLHFRNKEEWDAYVVSGTKLRNIPDEPDKVYKNFKTWEDWISVSYFSFDECVIWVRNNVSAKSKTEWESICLNLPVEVPVSPDEFYKNDGWVSWDLFLGYNKEDEKYLPYKDAQVWVEDNLLKHDLTEDTWLPYTKGEMTSLPKLPPNIPENPREFYKNTGWQSWLRWFGKHNYHRKLWPITYHECSRWVNQNLSLISTKEQWNEYITTNYPVKRPDYIPPNPHVIFRGIGWHGWDAFLSNGRKGRFYNELFGTQKIRILYGGEKIWVTPISMFKEIITGRVITVFCTPGADAEITFRPSDIINITYRGKDSTKKLLSNKYKI